MPRQELLITAETVDEATAEDLWRNSRLEAANLRAGLEGYEERERQVRAIVEEALDGAWHAEASLILDILDGGSNG